MKESLIPDLPGQNHEKPVNGIEVMRVLQQYRDGVLSDDEAYKKLMKLIDKK